MIAIYARANFPAKDGWVISVGKKGWLGLGTSSEEGKIMQPEMQVQRKEVHMKEICKNCAKCKPTYKGGYCEDKMKKVRLSGTCEYWCPKR